MHLASRLIDPFVALVRLETINIVRGTLNLLRNMNRTFVAPLDYTCREARYIVGRTAGGGGALTLSLRRNGTKVGEVWVSGKSGESGAVKSDDVDLAPVVSKSSDSPA
ncbi:hypothetical protein Tco_1142648 [Tanacetum coccineum]